VADLDRARRSDLGVDALRPWTWPSTRATARRSAPSLPTTSPASSKRLAVCSSAIDPDLARQFATLQLGRDLDLDSRKGKRPGGYQSSLEESRRPFSL